MPEGTHTRALRHVAKQLGGVPALAKRLGVLPGAIDGWIHGDREMPAATFQQVVDILLDHCRPHYY